jgi:hypothetical protein
MNYRRCPLWVRTRKARYEHMLAGLPSIADVHRAPSGFAFSSVGRYLTACSGAPPTPARRPAGFIEPCLPRI